MVAMRTPIFLFMIRKTLSPVKKSCKVMTGHERIEIAWLMLVGIEVILGCRHGTQVIELLMIHVAHVFDACCTTDTEHLRIEVSMRGLIFKA